MMRKRTFYYIFFGFFFVIILVIPLIAFLLPKGKAVYYLAVSLNMMREGDTEGAVKQAEKAVELRPESVVTLRGLARAYIEAGRHDDEALSVVEKLVAKAPESAEAYYFLGVQKLYREDIEGAREAVRKSIALAPNFPESYQLLGALAMEEKDWGAAETHLAKAVELNPNNPRSSYLLGLVFYEKNDYYTAIDHFKNVTRLMPDFAPAHAVLAMCYLQQQLYIHALSELNAAVDLDPADYNSMYNIACIYSLQNKPEPALKWLERSLNNGFSDFEHMEQDPDLDNIRELPEYIEMVQRARAGTIPGEGTSDESDGEPTE
jgi:Flp pilus assembly protein TadD